MLDQMYKVNIHISIQRVRDMQEQPKKHCFSLIV